MKDIDEEKLGAMDDFAIRRLRRLVSLKIPSWENFDVADLINIRQGKGFQAWRSNLGRAIDEVFQNEITNEAEVRRFLSESLDEARASVNKETSTSKFMNDRRAVLKSFAIGGSAALVMSPFLDVSKTLLLSSTQTAISLAVAKLLSKRTAPNETALQRHYLLFNP